MRREIDGTYITTRLMPEEASAIRSLGQAGAAAMDCCVDSGDGSLVIRYSLSNAGLYMQRRLEHLAAEANIRVECPQGRGGRLPRRDK